MGDSQKILQVRSARQVPVQVRLLDDDVFNHSVDKRALGWILFEKVCEHLNIIERDYFGLNYINPAGEKYWLNNDKKISKQMKGQNWNFHFEVKFYPADPAQLAEDLTRYQLCLQIRRDIVNERLPCSFVTYTMLGSYTAQSEMGDYDTEEFGSGYKYLKDIQFAPHQDKELLIKIAEIHRQHKGQTPEEAELHYLENAKKLAMYGVELHPAKDAEGKDIQIGVGASGLTIYKDKVQVNRFVWPKVLKMSYRRNKFYIKIRPGEFEEFASLVGFKLLNVKYAKRLWKISVEHHSFFRFREPEPPKHASLLPRFGSRFRYSGRTQFQTRQVVAEEARESPFFDRVLSKRGTFAGRTQNMRKRDEDRQRLRNDMRRMGPPMPQTKAPLPPEKSPINDEPRPSPRDRHPPEPAHPPPVHHGPPAHAPPVAPKPKPAVAPKPYPRGSRESLDNIDKETAGSLNDSFEDVPDRRSRMEKMHAVATPLAAVIRKGLDKKRQDEHDEQSLDRHSVDDERYHDTHQPEVGSYSQINQHTNQAFTDNTIQGACGARDKSHNPYAQISDVSCESSDLYVTTTTTISTCATVMTNTTAVSTSSEKYLFSYPSSSIDSILSHDDYAVDENDTGDMGTKLHASDHDLTGYKHKTKQTSTVPLSKSVGALHSKQESSHYDEIPIDYHAKHSGRIYQDIDEVKEDIQPLRDKVHVIENPYAEIPAQKIMGRRSQRITSSQQPDSNKAVSAKKTHELSKPILKSSKSEQKRKLDLSFGRKLFGRTSSIFKNKQKSIQDPPSGKIDKQFSTLPVTVKEKSAIPESTVAQPVQHKLSQAPRLLEPKPHLPMYATINKETKTIIKPNTPTSKPPEMRADLNVEPSSEQDVPALYSKPIKQKTSQHQVSENVPKSLREEFKMYLLDPDKQTSPRQDQTDSNNSESQGKSATLPFASGTELSQSYIQHTDDTPFATTQNEKPKHEPDFDTQSQSGTSNTDTVSSTRSRDLEILSYDMEPSSFRHGPSPNASSHKSLSTTSDNKNKTEKDVSHKKTTKTSIDDVKTSQKIKPVLSEEKNTRPESNMPSPDEISPRLSQVLVDLSSSSMCDMYKLDFGSSINSSIRTDEPEDSVQLLQVEDTELERYSNVSSCSSDLDLRYVSLRSEDMNNTQNYSMEKAEPSSEFEEEAYFTGPRNIKESDPYHFDNSGTGKSLPVLDETDVGLTESESELVQTCHNEGEPDTTDTITHEDKHFKPTNQILDSSVKPSDKELSNIKDSFNIVSASLCYPEEEDKTYANEAIEGSIGSFTDNGELSSVKEVTAPKVTSQVNEKQELSTLNGHTSRGILTDNTIVPLEIHCYDEEPFSRKRFEQDTQQNTVGKDNMDSNQPDQDESPMDFFTRPKYLEEFKSSDCVVTEDDTVFQQSEGVLEDDRDVIDSLETGQIDNVPVYENLRHASRSKEKSNNQDSNSHGSDNQDLVQQNQAKEPSKLAFDEDSDIVSVWETPVKDDTFPDHTSSHVSKRKLDFSFVSEDSVSESTKDKNPVLPSSKVYSETTLEEFQPRKYYELPNQESENVKCAKKYTDNAESNIIAGNLKINKNPACKESNRPSDSSTQKHKSNQHTLPLIAGKNVKTLHKLAPIQNRANTHGKFTSPKVYQDPDPDISLSVDNLHEKGHSKGPHSKIYKESFSTRLQNESSPKTSVTKPGYNKTRTVDPSRKYSNTQSFTSAHIATFDNPIIKPKLSESTPSTQIKTFAQPETPDTSFTSVSSLGCSDTQSDKTKTKERRKKKMTPGVVHMLNPCPSGWMEGGLKPDIQKEKAKLGDNHGNKHKTDSKPKFTVSVLDFEPPQLKETQDITRDVTVSCLDFKATNADQEKHSPQIDSASTNAKVLPKADLLCRRVWTYPKGKPGKVNKTKPGDTNKPEDDDYGGNGTKGDDFDTEILKGPWIDNVKTDPKSDDNSGKDAGSDGKGQVTEAETRSNDDVNSDSQCAILNDELENAEDEPTICDDVYGDTKSALYVTQLPEDNLKTRLTAVGLKNVNINENEIQAHYKDMHNIEFMDCENSFSDSDPSETDSDSGDEIELAFFEMPTAQGYDHNSSFEGYDNVVDGQVAIDCSFEDVKSYKMTDSFEPEDASEKRGPEEYFDKIPRMGRRVYKVPDIIEDIPYVTSKSNLKTKAKSESSLSRRVRFPDNLPVYKSANNVSQKKNDTSDETRVKSIIPYITTDETKRLKAFEKFITCLFEAEPKKVGRQEITYESVNVLKTSEEKQDSNKERIAKIDAELQALSKLENEVDEWKSSLKDKESSMESKEPEKEHSESNKKPNVTDEKTQNNDIERELTDIINDHSDCEDGIYGETDVSSCKNSEDKVYGFVSECVAELNTEDEKQNLSNHKTEPLVLETETIQITNELTDTSIAKPLTEGESVSSPLDSCGKKTVPPPNDSRITRYSFTINDDSDSESPTIKTVTYEYVTEYKLNNVMIQYQQNRKTQTELADIQAPENMKQIASIKQHSISGNDVTDSDDTAIVVEEVMEKSICYPLGPIHGIPCSFGGPDVHTDTHSDDVTIEVEEQIDKSVEVKPKPSLSQDKADDETLADNGTGSEQKPVLEEPVERTVFYGLQSSGTSPRILQTDKQFLQHDSQKFVWSSALTNIPFKQILVDKDDGCDLSDKEPNTIKDIDMKTCTKSLSDRSNMSEIAIVIDSDCTLSQFTTCSRCQHSLQRFHPRCICDTKNLDEQAKLQRNWTMCTSKDNSKIFPEYNHDEQNDPKQYKSPLEKHGIENTHHQNDNRKTIEDNKSADAECIIPGNLAGAHGSNNRGSEDGLPQHVTGTDTEAVADKEDVMYSALMQERLPVVNVEVDTEERIHVMQALAVMGLGAVLVFLMPYV